MKPLVSIVTVSLNSAVTISDTLGSVARQQAPFDIEHVCVDGGSTDGTREMIVQAALGNPHLVHLFEADRGLFDAMNKGLRLAQGRYILFLNSDDFLASATSVADAFKSVDLTSASPDMVMGDVIMAHLDTFGIWRMRHVPRWLPWFPRLGAHPPHQGNFIIRELLLRIEGFDTDQRLAADTTQFYRLAHEFNPSMHVSGSVVSFMRMGGASNKKLASFGRGNQEAYRFLRRYRPPAVAAFMIVVKVAQKLFEYRLGRLRRGQFISASVPASQPTDKSA